MSKTTRELAEYNAHHMTEFAQRMVIEGQQIALAVGINNVGIPSLYALKHFSNADLSRTLRAIADKLDKNPIAKI